MKTFRLFAIFLMVAVCAMFVTSCSDEDDNFILPTITYETKSINFELEGGIKEFSFECNKEWTISINQEEDYKESNWLEIYPIKGGAGSNKIEVKTTTNNEEYKPRKAYFSIQCGNTTQTMSINQNAKNYVLHIETAGTLSSLLGTKNNQLGNLTLLGDLNGDDIKAMRNMKKLSILNLENANIVEGGDFYYKSAANTYYYTENNKLPDYMFYLTQNKLISIILPNNITSIGKGALWEQDFSEIKIPSEVQHISESAFGCCRNLLSITIPNSVISIGYQAFINCERLSNVILPNSVTFIDRRTFEKCASLTSITIGNNIRSIGEYAFLWCNELAEIYSKNSVPPAVHSNAFIGIDKKKCKLYIPKGSIRVYRSTDIWKDFETIIEEDNEN